jgi:hypothetical protein
LGLLGWWSLGEGLQASIGPSLAQDLERAPKSKQEQLVPTPDPAPTNGDDESRTGPATASASLPARAHVRHQGPTQLHTDIPVPAVPTQADTDAGWARVTEAMRKRDWEAAKIALEPLTNSVDEETRDGARLVRIRLELGAAQGAPPDQRWLTDLAELAASGSTSSIRASARRLLEELRVSQAKPVEPSPDLPSEEK